MNSDTPNSIDPAQNDKPCETAPPPSPSPGRTAPAPPAAGSGDTVRMSSQEIVSQVKMSEKKRILRRDDDRVVIPPPPAVAPPSSISADSTVIMSKREQEAYCERAAGQGPARYHIIPQARNEPDRIAVVLFKPLDLMDGQRLRDQLSEFGRHPFKNWDIDLTQLSFCDSASLSICVMVKLVAQRHRGKVTLYLQRDSQIHQVLVQSKLDKIMDLVFET